MKNKFFDKGKEDFKDSKFPDFKVVREGKVTKGEDMNKKFNELIEKIKNEK